MDDFRTVLGLEPEELVVLYADDIIIFGRNLDRLNSLLSKAQNHAEENHYAFNTSKCVSSCSGVFLGGKELTVFTSVKYLGVTITRRGIDTTPYVAQCQAKAISSTSQLIDVIGKSPLSPQQLISAYTTFVRPALEYALVVAPLEAAHYHSLDMCQATLLKRLLQLKNNTHYKVLHLCLGVPNFMERTTVLRWRYGHALWQDFLKNRQSELAGYGAPSSTNSIWKDPLFSSYRWLRAWCTYARSKWLEHDMETAFLLSHGLSKSRPEFNKGKLEQPNSWGFSPELYAHLRR